ncbi:1676_t:CDS:2, partial [Paraglomus brasilianum]
YNSQSELTSNYRPQYFKDLGETKYIKKNKRKEPIETLYKNLEKLKSDLKAELFELALRYESKNNETLNIHNCYENEEYWEIVDTIRRINLTIEYQEQTYSQYYQAQPEKEKQECLQSSYIKFLEELYEKQ